MSRFRNHLAQQRNAEKSEILPNALFKQARTTGQLNLSNRGFDNVPEEVWNLNKSPNDADSDFSSGTNENWWDQVELTKLILASNTLTSLSEKVSVFPALVVLDLHDNKLTGLPDSIGDLARLEKLDLSHNEIQSVPESLTCLGGLTVLLLQHNKLEKLPESFGNLVSVQNLDLSNNKIHKLPSEWDRMTTLRKLNLSQNQLTNLPRSICNLKSLVFLDLNANLLSNLPQDLGLLKSLQQLYLRNNELVEVPILANSEGLKELYFANNRLEEFQVSKLPVSLVILELRDNKLESIESGITGMKSLQRLDLANNNITALPPEIGLMEQIKAINVEGNPMRSIRRDIISKGTQAIMKYLRTRIVQNDSADKNGSFQRSGGDALPGSTSMSDISEKHSLAKSRSLDLSKTPWTDKTEKVLDDCSNIPMESINFSKMAITQFPAKVSCFQASLKTLNLSVNKLSTLSSEIGSFISLTHLDISTNSLSDLPKEMSSLKKVIELNIVQNRFTALPNCIFEMSNLEHLLAGGNQITSIDVSGLRKLPVLSTLALQNNNISQVPPELGLMSSIRNLQIEGNMFRMPRQNIVQQGTLAIMEYLKNRVPAQ